MRLGRTLPPAAAPVSPGGLISGLKGMIRGAAELRRFEGELKAYHGAEHVFLVSSGKAALWLILKALHRLCPDRDEVVIPAFTCYSVPSAVLRAGLRMRLCDIDPDTLDFDYPSLEELVSAETAGRLLAVIPTHLFGVPADVGRVRRLAQGTPITVIEDAAQALGGHARGRRLGTLGDVGFISLGRGKALTTVEGGVVLTSRGDIAAAIAEEVARLKGYTAPGLMGLAVQATALALFTDPRLFWFPKALPFLRLGETHLEPRFPLRQMSGLQAGLARGWRQTLGQVAATRQANARAWAAALKGCGALRPPKAVDPSTSLLRYPLLVRDPGQRQAIVQESERCGLGVMRAYPESLDRLDGLAMHTDGAGCPGARSVARQLVTLPVHRYVTGGDRHRIKGMLCTHPGSRVC